MSFDRARVTTVLHEMEAERLRLASLLDSQRAHASHLESGKELLASGDAIGALKQFERVVAAYPSAALPRDLAEGCRSQARDQEARNQRLSELTTAARRAIDAGDFAVAIERCEEALELWPHHELAATLRSLRMHGQGADRYDNTRIGTASRLDTIQAAVLIEKLKIFTDEIDARNRVAQRYKDGLGDVAVVPRIPDGMTSVWAQYTIRLKPGQREQLAPALKDRGIPTAIYYPKPVHRQEAYRSFPVVDGGLPVSDALAAEVISLPMHPYLDEPTQDRIISAVRNALGRN
jgi:tetratricopeptide (TPR) repeat protein